MRSATHKPGKSGLDLAGKDCAIQRDQLRHIHNIANGSKLSTGQGRINGLLARSSNRIQLFSDQRALALVEVLVKGSRIELAPWHVEAAHKLLRSSEDRVRVGDGYLHALDGSAAV